MKKIFLIVILLFMITACDEEIKPSPSDDTLTVLKTRGYEEEVIGVLMNRLSDDEIEILKEYDYIEDINYYVSFDYFKFDYLQRYLSYKKETNYNYETVVTFVNIGLDKDFYDEEIIMVSNNPDETTVLVNKYHQLPSDYEPNLQVISSSCGIGKLKQEAKEAFESMCMDASSLGYTIKSISAYRSFDYQYNLYESYVKEDGIKLTDTYSARAGHSEHQTGLALDIAGSNGNYTKIESTKEFPWIKENAHLYGFIIRYQKGKEHITGYKYEPWHLRYVGKEIATYIYENDITYDEYYEKFLAK